MRGGPEGPAWPQGLIVSPGCPGRRKEERFLITNVFLNCPGVYDKSLAFLSLKIDVCR